MFKLFSDKILVLIISDDWLVPNRDRETEYMRCVAYAPFVEPADH